MDSEQFPSHKNLGKRFPNKQRCFNKVGSANRKQKDHVRKKKKIDIEKNIVTSRDAFLSSMFKGLGIEDTDEMKSMVYRKCFLLLNGIARIQKDELKWNTECKSNIFFSRVSLSCLKIIINPSRGENELDSQIMASYSFFVFLINTFGLLKSQSDRMLFINIILKSSCIELRLVAVQMNYLIRSFSTSFGSSVSAGCKPLNAENAATFKETRLRTIRELRQINAINTSSIESNEKKEISSSLAELYGEIDKIGGGKGTKKVFESSDEEDEVGKSLNVIQKNEEIIEKMLPMREVKREFDIENERSRNKHGKELDRKSVNGWDEYKEEENTFNHTSVSNSTWHEFRCNLIELSKESWSKCVAMYSIENEPSVAERFRMAQFIIECLEEKYGDELLEILQYFTFQSFDPTLLKKKEEVIGLLLYLDQRVLIGENFFFLLLAMNEKEVVGTALEGSEICCRAQLKAAKIGRSAILGKTNEIQHLAANQEAATKKKILENTKYHIFFPGIIEENTMKKLANEKRGKDREIKKEIRLTSIFAEEFWTSSSALFNVESEWTTYKVNESAVRVFTQLNLIFGETLIKLLRTMGGRRLGSDSLFSDPRSGQSLTALFRMKNSGFLNDSLLFALLRFNDEIATKKTLNRLSRLCDGFKKMIEAGSKSKGLKTDSDFLSIKDNFVERAEKVNTECIQFFEVLMNTKGRKRCLSNCSTDNRMEIDTDDNIEPKKKRRKEISEEIVKGKKREKKDSDGGDTTRNIIQLKKIKEEPNEFHNGRKSKKERNDEKKNDDNECMIVEVEKKIVKIEVISDGEEENDLKRNRRDSRISEFNDGSFKEKVERRGNYENVNIKMKKEVKEEDERDGTNSSSCGIEEREMNVQEDLMIENDIVPDLIGLRKRLCMMSDYWAKSLTKFEISSSKVPTIDDQFKIAKTVIKFYEDNFGDTFHNALSSASRVQFTPSDLQEKEEVIGLVLYLDKIWLSIPYFYFFILVLNDESKVNIIMDNCKETLELHLKCCQQFNLRGQSKEARSEYNRLTKIRSAQRKQIRKKMRLFFGGLCDFNKYEKYKNAESSESTILYPVEKLIPVPECGWRYISEWKVTTFWSKSNEWNEWENKHMSDMERLCHRITKFMTAAVMREEDFAKKVRALEWIKSRLNEVMDNEWTLDIIGSSLCSLGAANSNLDLFMNTKKHIDLPAIVDLFMKEKGVLVRPFRKRTIHILIPKEGNEGVFLPVSIHASSNAAYMARVYQVIDRQDERVSSLALVLKAWNILDIQCATAKMQSYHVMILLIHFLQCGVSPPILPSLTQLYPQLDPILYHSLNLPEQIPIENSESLASLLIGFFIYFSHFEFDKYIISIREGYLFKRSVLNCNGSSTKIMMEYPSDNCLTKNLGIFVFTEVDYEPIRMACKKALESLVLSFSIPSLPIL